MRRVLDYVLDVGAVIVTAGSIGFAIAFIIQGLWRLFHGLPICKL